MTIRIETEDARERLITRGAAAMTVILVTLGLACLLWGMMQEAGAIHVGVGIVLICAAMPFVFGLFRNPLKAMVIEDDRLIFVSRFKETVFQWKEIAAIRILDKHVAGNVTFTLHSVPVSTINVDDVAHYLVVFRHDGSQFKTLLPGIVSGRVWRALGETKAELLPGGGSITCKCGQAIPVMEHDAGLEKACPSCNRAVNVPSLSALRELTG